MVQGCVVGTVPVQYTDSLSLPTIPPLLKNPDHTTCLSPWRAGTRMHVVLRISLPVMFVRDPSQIGQTST